MTEEQGGRAGVGQWVRAIRSWLSGDTAAVGKKDDRPGRSAEKLAGAGRSQVAEIESEIQAELRRHLGG